MVWPLGCVCHAVRAPGVKWTLAADSREGSDGVAIASMKTAPVNQSLGPGVVSREFLVIRMPLSSWATVVALRLATWNVNSIKQRVPRLLPWLDERRPDAVCLQETKLADDAFAELLGDELAARGYAVAVHGEATWNGVAILSRVGLDDVVAGLAGAPGFPHPEARALSATCGGIRGVSVYVPDGRVPGSEHYEYKPARPRSLAERAGVHLLGLPGRNVPPGPRDADRSGAGQRPGRTARPRGMGGPPR